MKSPQTRIANVAPKQKQNRQKTFENQNVYKKLEITINIGQRADRNQVRMMCNRWPPPEFLLPMLLPMRSKAANADADADA